MGGRRGRLAVEKGRVTRLIPSAGPLVFPSGGAILAAILDGHAHISVMFALDVIAIVLIFHFLTRTYAGLYPNNAALRGASYVA